MKNNLDNNPQFYQEEDYNFPYHHLPQLNNGFWSFGISWFHSLDYLTLLEFILSKIKEKNANKILDFGCGDLVTSCMIYPQRDIYLYIYLYIHIHICIYIYI